MLALVFVIVLTPVALGLWAFGYSDAAAVTVGFGAVLVVLALVVPSDDVRDMESMRRWRRQRDAFGGKRP